MPRRRDERGARRRPVRRTRPRWPARRPSLPGSRGRRSRRDWRPAPWRSSSWRDWALGPPDGVSLRNVFKNLSGGSLRGGPRYRANRYPLLAGKFSDGSSRFAETPLDPGQHRRHAAQSQRADQRGKTRDRCRSRRARRGSRRPTGSSRPVARIAAKPRVVGASAGALKYSRTCSRSSASTCRNSGD